MTHWRRSPNICTYPDCDCASERECPGEGRFMGNDWVRFWQVVVGAALIGVGAACLVLALTVAGGH
jgi:hypothetical protein